MLGKCCWGTAHDKGSASRVRVEQLDLQLGDSRAGEGDAEQERAHKSQWQEHNLTFAKRAFQDTYYEKAELVSSVHHHHSTCCLKGDNPMSMEHDFES